MTRPTRSASHGVLAVLAAGAGLVATALPVPPAGAAPGDYTFTVVADSTEDGLDPFSFGCASINDPGDVAFRAGRLADDGFNTVDGIYRVDAGSDALTTIAEKQRFDFLARNPSMNDRGQVSFAASFEDDTEAILRGRGGPLTTIAQTRGPRFNFFGFDTSVNNAGRVAFRAELDRRFGFDEGLFSGAGDAVATHFLASTSRFRGTDSRPSINDDGDIAFEEQVRSFARGVFVTRGAGFRTVATPDPDRDVREPVLNNAGTAAFETSFTDEQTQGFVSAIVKGRSEPLTTVVDTRGSFVLFGFRPPSLNNLGNVAFHGTLDDAASTSGVFVGPRPEEDRVLVTGDTIEGDTVTNVVFSEEGLNDSGQLVVSATLDDPDAPDGFREAIVVATPQA